MRVIERFRRLGFGSNGTSFSKNVGRENYPARTAGKILGIKETETCATREWDCRFAYQVLKCGAESVGYGLWDTGRAGQS